MATEFRHFMRPDCLNDRHDQCPGTTVAVSRPRNMGETYAAFVTACDCACHDAPAFRRPPEQEPLLGEFYD